MQILVDALLAKTRPPVQLMLMVDKQAIIAIEKGYSKKLRHLERTHKCSIGATHELIIDDGEPVQIEWASTKKHAGDGFTKAMDPAGYLIARDMLSMVFVPKT